MLTLGYLKEKNRLVEEPKIANKMDKDHMRGVLMDKVVSSVGATEARTWAYGESSDGWLFDAFKSCNRSSSSDVLSSASGSSTWLLLEDDCRLSNIRGTPVAAGTALLAVNRDSTPDP
jgi:hypothetical protein